MEITLDSRVYSKNGIVKCMYWYSSSCDVNIIIDANSNYVISVVPKDEITIEEFRSKLLQDLNDYNLRDLVSNETKPIRELIAAKAFSNGEFDEEPFGELDDPLGIKLL